MTRRRSHPGGDERLRQAALFWVAGVRLGLYLLPVPEVRRLARRACLPVAHRTRTPETRPTPGAIGSAVRGATRAVPRATCLTQALAAEALLTRFGWPAEVHLGVQREGEAGLAAHAWVECRGEVVVGDGPRGHAPIGSLDATSSHPRGAADAGPEERR